VLVTIGIPTYNRAHLVTRAIASVVRQTYEDIEVVVVDDGSTDETLSVLRAIDDPRLRILPHSVNRGVNAAKNSCLDGARGDWIGLLDSDDELVDNAVEALMQKVRELQPGTNLGTVMCNCRTVPGGELSGKGVDADGFVSYDDFLSGRVDGEFWGIFSRKVLGSHRLDERLRSFESLLWFHFYKASATYYLHQPLRLYYTQAADGISNIDNILRSAGQVLRGYDGVLAQWGDDLRARFPKRYAHYLRRKAIFEIMGGERSRAASAALEALRFDVTSEALAVALAVVFPRKVVAHLLGRRSHRQHQQRVGLKV
jgi:GalNAc5-diNAcBac-PP-undecaprenol beta-1,3-glucosyltransferase